MMNLVMLLSTPVYILLLGMASGEVGKTVLAVSLSALVVIYVVLLRVFKAFGKSTYYHMKTFNYRGTILTIENQ